MSQDSMLPTRWLSLSGRELRVVATVALLALGTCGVTYVARNYWWRGGVTVRNDTARLPRPERLNINAAEKHELQLLPGIGPATATAILQYRRKHGEFAGMDELKKVKGIGPSTVEDIRPHSMCGPTDSEQGN